LGAILIDRKSKPFLNRYFIQCLMENRQCISIPTLAYFAINFQTAKQQAL
jgi:hypothetical protein